MLNLSSEKAFALWKKYMGNQPYTYDFAGRKIKKEDYNVDNEVGWVIDYICPLQNGGESNIDNLIIMHRRTCLDKADNYPVFQVDFKKFEIVKDIKGNFYYIEELLEDED